MISESVCWWLPMVRQLRALLLIFWSITRLRLLWENWPRNSLCWRRGRVSGPKGKGRELGFLHPLLSLPNSDWGLKKGPGWRALNTSGEQPASAQGVGKWNPEKINSHARQPRLREESSVTTMTEMIGAASPGVISRLSGNWQFGAHSEFQEHPTKTTSLSSRASVMWVGHACFLCL